MSEREKRGEECREVEVGMRKVEVGESAPTESLGGGGEQ